MCWSERRCARGHESLPFFYVTALSTASLSLSLSSTTSSAQRAADADDAQHDPRPGVSYARRMRENSSISPLVRADLFTDRTNVLTQRLPSPNNRLLLVVPIHLSPGPCCPTTCN